MPDIKMLEMDIQDIIKKVTSENEKPAGLVEISENKDGSVSVWMIEPINKSKGKLLFKIELKGKSPNKYFSVVMKTISRRKFQVPNHAAEKILDSSPENTYIAFENSIDGMHDFLEAVIRNGVLTFQPSERFGCCHRYVECSRAGKCIAPDPFYSLACWYRKNFEEGKVFY